ncbi:hypothetical protein ACWEQN_44435, partial [Streptomyces sp. NPDC004129]
ATVGSTTKTTPDSLGAATLRMAGAIPARKLEHDEWIAFPRRYLPEGSMPAIHAADHTTHALHNTPNPTAVTGKVRRVIRWPAFRLAL